MKICCPCDEWIHPVKPDIPAGLARLPRQLAGFPEYRLAMLRDLANYAPLSDWRAREGDDLGLMLIEMWAYVLDILGFYDERIANEAYLRTAVLRPSIRRLVELIGYQPRPALAASVVLAAIADGNKPVRLPPQTGFRSDAFDAEPPQVFETELEHTIHALKNEWALVQVRERFPGPDLLLEPRSAALQSGDIVLTRWTNGVSAGSSLAFRAGHVTNVSTIKALDGGAYKKVEIASTGLMLDPSIALIFVELLTPTQKALPHQGLDAIGSGNPTSIMLDSIYPELGENDSIVVQRGMDLHAALIRRLGRADIPVETAVAGVTIPVTKVFISPAIPHHWNHAPERLVVHYGMRSAGKFTNVAKTHLGVADFDAPGIAMEGIIEPLPSGIETSSQLLLLDAQDNGVLASGDVEISPQGNGSVRLASDTRPFNPPLRTPVAVFGNPVYATRGESVFNEILGSGDASQIFQSFALASKPLTWFNDPSAPSGRRSTLGVRVNGIEWMEVSSFFGAGQEDEVYIVRENDEQETSVTFGNGTMGARLPTGIDNVVATYRFGAGAAKPPTGAIGQLSRPVEGLRRIVNPVTAGGGADADQPENIRSNAPVSSLTLGRAISLADFEALAREFGGVVNAEALWAWDESRQRAVVKIWFISDGGDVSEQLRAFLVAQSAPDTPLTAEQARSLLTHLVIDIEVDARFEAAVVKQAVINRLTDDATGILAPRNITIARPLFRSRIFAQITDVDGVSAIRTMTVDGSVAPFAITSPEGFYREFTVHV